ncbi:hypothetical protein HK100_003528 [Physocladia obscura]|uniref:Glucanase n=1 Tax=Physocladia obscura TaxID=109957 RepID=A0AAD5XEI8_9FUNG|nr:hypothetical protein HK100_003528 [Physocladia obscura]
MQSSVAIDSSLSCAVGKLSSAGQSIWLDTMAAISLVAPALAQASTISAGAPIIIQFVIYDLPGRDCAALASNGELPATDAGIATYKSDYIDPIVSNFTLKASNIRLVLIIEPDSLPNILTNSNLATCATAAPYYREGIEYALSQFANIPNVYMYLDIAHGGWLGWPSNLVGIVPIMQSVITAAVALNPAVSAAVRGFATNVANYSPTHANGVAPVIGGTLSPGTYDGVTYEEYEGNPAIDETTYVQLLTITFNGTNLPTNFVIDTSRNGRAGIRDAWGDWCNVNGSGIGYFPQVSPDSTTPNLDAYTWIKPAGDSDGTSNTTAPRYDAHCGLADSLQNAPQAGQWFHAEFDMLVKNANPAIVGC